MTSNCVRLRDSVHTSLHVLELYTFVSSFSPWSLINVGEKYRSKLKTQIRGENCWCLHGLSWTAVRAVDLPLMMLFPRLTPPCKLQLQAGGMCPPRRAMASLCVLCIFLMFSWKHNLPWQADRNGMWQDKSKILSPKLLVFQLLSWLYLIFKYTLQWKKRSDWVNTWDDFLFLRWKLIFNVFLLLIGKRSGLSPVSTFFFFLPLAEFWLFSKHCFLFFTEGKCLFLVPNNQTYCNNLLTG